MERISLTHSPNKDLVIPYNNILPSKQALPKINILLKNHNHSKTSFINAGNLQPVLRKHSLYQASTSIIEPK